MTIKFTGDVAFKNKLLAVLVLNETSPAKQISNTPYVLSWAKTDNSG